MAVTVACEVNTRVNLIVDEDGSGLVQVIVLLDGEATDALGDVESTVRLDDIAEAGWEVRSEATDPGWLFVLAKPFEHPDALQLVLDEVAGPDTIFRQFGVRLTDEFAATRYQVSGTVDWNGDLSTFTDDAVELALDGFEFGFGPDEADAALDGATAVLSVGVQMPGDGEPTRKASIDLLGAETSERIDVTTTHRDSDAYRWILVAGGLVVLALGIGLTYRRRS